MLTAEHIPHAQGGSKAGEMRTSAASSARFLPVATPTPSMAVPELHMTALTSAKSTLTRPGMVMMSEMPWTPCMQHNLGQHMLSHL